MEKIRLRIQVLFTTLTNGYLKGFLDGKIYQGKTKTLCLPGLNCYSCPGALGSCPIGSLQAVITSRDYKFSFYIVGFLFLIGSLMGRLVCGFLCPFGLVQDLLYRIPFIKKIKEVPYEKYFKKLKYLILLIFVLILPMFLLIDGRIGTPWFCKLICPAGTLMGGLPLVIRNESIRQAVGILFSWKLLILGLIIYLSIKIERPFCKFLCPLGAIYGFFNPIALYRYRLDEVKCIDCKLCEKNCPMNIATYENPNDFECIRCGRCMEICPTDAIEDSISNFKCRKKEEKGEENL